MRALGVRALVTPRPLQVPSAAKTHRGGDVVEGSDIELRVSISAGRVCQGNKRIALPPHPGRGGKSVQMS